MEAAISCWQDERLKEQIKKSRQLNWNIDVVYWAAFEYGFRVVQHNENHLSLHFSKKKRLDYWPNINKGLWYYKNKSEGKPFDIPDIEAYLIDYFKQKQYVHDQSEQ